MKQRAAGVRRAMVKVGQAAVAGRVVSRKVQLEACCFMVTSVSASHADGAGPDPIRGTIGRLRQ
jgi:hypothetical protein